MSIHTCAAPGVVTTDVTSARTIKGSLSRSVIVFVAFEARPCGLRRDIATAPNDEGIAVGIS